VKWDAVGYKKSIFLVIHLLQLVLQSDYFLSRIL